MRPDIRRALGAGRAGRRAAVTLVALALAGAAAGLAQGQVWELQRLQLSNRAPPSPPLQKTLTGPASLGSYDFVGKVGGVAFAAVAELDAGLAGDDLRLLYDAARPDGQRLVIEVGGRRHPQQLYDWILVPAARYADSPHNACASLFGPASTEREYDIVYHEALGDSLLGLRVLQADILFFDLEQTWDLPRLDGRVVLGAGEVAPESLDRPTAVELSQALGRGSFQSWVLTDVGVRVGAGLEQGRLELGGEPYYYFWNSDHAEYERTWDRLYAEAQAARARGDVAGHNRIADQINRLEPHVVAVPAITDALRQRQRQLRRFNPAVYDAVGSLMRYAAFFRAVKAARPAAWERFLANLPSTAGPAIRTPTRWLRPR